MRVMRGRERLQKLHSQFFAARRRRKPEPCQPRDTQHQHQLSSLTNFPSDGLHVLCASGYQKPRDCAKQPFAAYQQDPQVTQVCTPKRQRQFHHRN